MLTISWNEKKEINRVTEEAKADLLGEPGYSLLDSSLIIKYKNNYYDKNPNKLYNCKILKCGDYIQLYFFKNKHFRKKENLENELIKEKNINRLGEKKFLEYKNILRAKFNLQRIVKSNESVFKTFITLTFEENITDIKEANKQFNYWVSNIRKRRKKDFAYVCVPEYQKRGAVHYHLMTNVEITDTSVIIPQKLRNKKTSKLKKLYDVVYWNSGYSSVFDLKNIDNVTAYITKYMTKDYDNRLFGFRKYHYSRNLIVPKEEFIDINDLNQFNYLKKLTKGCELKYQNKYKNSYSLEDVNFIEYKLVDIIIIIRNGLIP